MSSSRPSRTPSPLFRHFEAFRHGNGSLIPLDWSWLAVRLMILGISTFSLVCWAYLLSSLFWTWPQPPLLVLAPSLWTITAHRYIWLPWSAVEAGFSIWYVYQAWRIQGPGPKPLYSRRFLHRVFARALKSGMGAGVGEDGVDAEEVDQALQGMRKRVTRGQHRGNGSSSHAQAPDEGEDPEPWFQRNRLDPLDPRAIQFQQDQSRWFHLPPDADSKGLITRRDGSRWLAWSLFSCTLEELEEEHRLLHSGQPGVAEKVESDLADKYRTLDDAILELGGDKDDAEDDPDLHKVMASPREWSYVKAGTRLDFIRKARRLIELRQGFAYPLTRGGPPGPEHDVDDEGRVAGSESPITESMRLTIDPVRVEPRPFLLYCFTQSLSTLTLLFAIYKGGFKLKTQGRLSYLVKVPRNWTPEKAADPANKGRYRPTIFAHGLGIGLAQYSSLVMQLAHSELAKTHPLMIPLQPHTSQAVFSRHFLKPLTHHEMVRCLRVAMRELGWEKVQILSHSMGTIVHSWLLKSLGEKVERSCFVDPVCVRLWIPDVAVSARERRRA